MYIIHGAKHLSNGKTTIIYSVDGKKRIAPDEETPPLEAFLIALCDIAIHFAIISGLARIEDYEIETGTDKTSRPKFKNPVFAKLFNMTGFSIDKKGLLTLTCTWKGGRTPATFNMNNINTNFESKAGYDHLQDLIEKLAQFRFQCGKFLDGAAGERKAPEQKPDTKKLSEPEIPFGQTKEIDVTDKYIEQGKSMEQEGLEVFQKGTSRTVDQSKPVHLSAKKGAGGNQQTPANPSGS